MGGDMGGRAVRSWASLSVKTGSGDGPASQPQGPRPRSHTSEEGGGDAPQMGRRQSGGKRWRRTSHHQSDEPSSAASRPRRQQQRQGSGTTAPAAGGQRRSNNLPPAQLTSIIKNQCFSLFDLECVVSDHGSAFNQINVSAAFVMLGNLVKPSSDYHRSHQRQDMAAAAELISRLSGLACSNMGDFGSREVSNTMYSVAKLHRMGYRGHVLLVNALISHGANLLRDFPRDFEPQNLANIVWALATLSHRDEDFTSALIYEARGKLPAFNAQALANIIWALATLGHRDEGFTSALISEARGKLPMFNPQNLSNTIWALATLGHRDDGFTSALISEARGKLPMFNPQNLSNTIWALATLGHRDDGFASALISEARRRLHILNPQDIANITWALATLGHRDDNFISAMISEARKKLPMFDPQVFSNTLWALATLGHRDDGFISTLMSEARGKLPMFNPQNLANTIWALATLGHHDEGFISALIYEAREKLPMFNPQNLANTIWALATLGHRDDGFTSTLISEARRKLPMLNSQELANIIWALAILGHRDDVSASALISQAWEKLSTFNRQDLANTVWALVVLYPNLQRQKDLFSIPGLLSAVTSNLDEFTDKSLRQLFMFFLAMKDQDWEADLIPEELWDMAKCAWLSNMSPNSSRTQLDVLRAIQSLPDCSEATGEMLTDDGFFSIDIALLRADGTKVAVEVDGPTHFTSNNPKRMNGSTVLRNHMLEARGWRVVSVPVETWSRVPQGRRKRYLLDLLESAQSVGSDGSGLEC